MSGSRVLTSAPMLVAVALTAVLIFQIGKSEATGAEADHSGQRSTEIAPANPLADTPTASPAPTPAATPTIVGLIWGDLDCSGGVDARDSLLTLRVDAYLPVNTNGCPEPRMMVMGSYYEVIWADWDCNGEITPVDSLKILRVAGGLGYSGLPPCPFIGNLSYFICVAHGSD